MAQGNFLESCGLISPANLLLLKSFLTSLCICPALRVTELIMRSTQSALSGSVDIFPITQELSQLLYIQGPSSIPPVARRGRVSGQILTSMEPGKGEGLKQKSA